VEESQFDPEEGSSGLKAVVNESSDREKPSTSSKQSPTGKKEESQSSAEDTRWLINKCLCFLYFFFNYLFIISDAEQEARNIIEQCTADYEACGYSPVYTSPNSLELGTLVVSELDDTKRLTFARLQVQGTGTRIEVSLLHVINIKKCQFHLFVLYKSTLINLQHKSSINNSVFTYVIDSYMILLKFDTY